MAKAVFKEEEEEEEMMMMMMMMIVFTRKLVINLRCKLAKCTFGA
jgi:hypothetical protein